jgi:hypothetical protein
MLVLPCIIELDLFQMLIMISICKIAMLSPHTCGTC